MNSGDEDNGDTDPFHAARLYALARRIRRYRRAADLTQQHVADHTSLSRPSVAQIEAGTRIPHLRTLFTLADALGVHPADLLDDRSD